MGGAIPLCVAMIHGLGKSDQLVNDEYTAQVAQATFISQIFILASLATAKCSVAYLLLRLFTRDLDITRKPGLICKGTLILTIMWGFASILAVSVQCQPSSLLDGAPFELCKYQLTRWRIVTFTNIFIEMLLVCLPMFFIWPIQMKVYTKVQVVLAFGLRIPVVAFASLHLRHVATFTRSSGMQASVAIIPMLAYQQLELFWSLIAATIPTLKSFMRSFNSGFGMEVDLDGYGSMSGHPGHGSFELDSLRRSDKRFSAVASKISTRLWPTERLGRNDTMSSTHQVRPDNVGHKASIYHSEHSGKDASSVGSHGSQEMIIKRQVEWTVRHEHQPASAGN